MIFVIHNDQRAERVENIKKEFAKCGITTFGIQKSIFASTPKAGISQAHRSVVAKAKEQNWAFVIIMEDDVRFTHPDSFNKFMAQIMICPEEVDILMAGLYTTTQFLDTPLKQFKEVADVSGFHCYCVFQKAYDRFLEAPDTYHIDKWATGKTLGKLKTYCSYPFLAIQQDGFYSDNKKQVKDYSHLIKNKKYELFEGNNPSNASRIMRKLD